MTEHTPLDLMLNRIEAMALCEFEARFHPTWVCDPMTEIEFRKEFQQLRELVNELLEALEKCVSIMYAEIDWCDAYQEIINESESIIAKARGE